MEADAQDYLIGLIRKLGSGKFTRSQVESSIRNWLVPYLKSKCKRATKKRRKEATDIHSPNSDTDPLELLPDGRCDESVEEYLSQFRDLKPLHRKLLRKVMYKRYDESLADYLTEKELYEWYKIVLPAMRRWATKKLWGNDE